MTRGINSSCRLYYLGGKCHIYVGLINLFSTNKTIHNATTLSSRKWRFWLSNFCHILLLILYFHTSSVRNWPNVPILPRFLQLFPFLLFARCCLYSGISIQSELPWRRNASGSRRSAVLLIAKMSELRIISFANFLRCPGWPQTGAGAGWLLNTFKSFPLIDPNFALSVSAAPDWQIFYVFSNFIEEKRRKTKSS